MHRKFNLRKKEEKLERKDLRNSVVINNAGLSIVEIQKELSNLKAITENDFFALLHQNVINLATSQHGSLVLQQSISKMSDDCIAHVFEEILQTFTFLLTHMFANYFCQRLYVRLCDADKHRAMSAMLNKLDFLLKGPISFKSVICLFEISICDQTQNFVVSYLKKIDELKFLRQTKYMKVLESLLTVISESKLGFLIKLVCNNVIHFVRTKQGYYLIRKLIKFMKKSEHQHQIVDSLIGKFSAVMSMANGVLLSNCIIKYFTQQLPEIRTFHSKSQQLSFSKQIFNEAVTLQKESFKSRFSGNLDLSAIFKFIKVYFLEYLCSKPASELQKVCQVYHKKFIQQTFTKTSLTENLNWIFKETIKSHKSSVIISKIFYFCGGTSVFKLLLRQFKNLGCGLEEYLGISFEGLSKEVEVEWELMIDEIKKEKSISSEKINFNEKLFLNLKYSDGSESQINSFDLQDDDDCSEFEKFAQNNKSFFESSNDKANITQGGKSNLIFEGPKFPYSSNFLQTSQSIVNQYANNFHSQTIHYYPQNIQWNQQFYSYHTYNNMQQYWNQIY